VPFPADATDIVYDENRPFLRCVTTLSIDAAHEFFTDGLAGEGWSPLSSQTIEGRYPHAKLSDTVEGGGKRAYFNREGRERNYPPLALTLQRSGDYTIVDLRTAQTAEHRLRKLGENNALIFSRLNDFRRLEYLFIAPVGMQRFDVGPRHCGGSRPGACDQEARCMRAGASPRAR